MRSLFGFIVPRAHSLTSEFYLSQSRAVFSHFQFINGAEERERARAEGARARRDGSRALPDFGGKQGPFAVHNCHPVPLSLSVCVLL